ncbi:MAG: hypothetical protein CHACPFDD_00593 [Phycisphaerae bacterium]|nr:hypothetical protein [Phycisphaerae bacterium]
MARWLVKSDPDEYSAADLERDGVTSWEGVRNPTAQGHLRGMRAGDEVLVYHTGKQKAIVARATVAAAGRPDPSDPNGKAVAVQLRFEAWLARPVSLADIKAAREFADFDLVRIGRLSVMPVSAAHWSRLMKMAAPSGA